MYHVAKRGSPRRGDGDVERDRYFLVAAAAALACSFFCK